MAGRPLGGWQVCNLLAPFPSQRLHPIMQCWGAALAHAPCMTRPLPAVGATRPCFCSVGKKRKGQDRTSGCVAGQQTRPVVLWWEEGCGGRRCCRWRRVQVCGHRWQRVTTG